ncbi:hypothetical protein KUF71_015080 [Frankliniella fusca]|uniref:Trithorax group protein osa-like n=1 Tax=Frankliniella fusca TaxID=407009 RepID=A0AAE1HSR9_9NEOP|nr:hypothetical protein KUF71_015080 [Frankliniella fusca]
MAGARDLDHRCANGKSLTACGAVQQRAGGPDRSGNFNVFFIPAYRLTGNRTGGGGARGAASSAVSPSTPPPLRLDPQTSARLLTAALSAAARLTASPSPPPPAHTTPAPTLPPARARAGLVRRAPQDGDDGSDPRDPPPQRHDAHILVTLQNYKDGAATGGGSSSSGAQPPSPPPVGAVGYGSAQHFNNYPAVNGHVPAHFGPVPVPYYSHFPVGAAGSGLGLTGPSAPSGPGGPGGGLLYQPLQRFSAAASALDLVSSSPLGVNPGTLLGTTGPLYASPGRPVGTLANLGSLGSLANAAASAPVQDAAATTSVDPDPGTTNVPVTTTTPAPASTPSPTTTTTASSASPTTEATATSRDPKADAEEEVEPRTTPFRQTFEFGRSDSSRRLNLTEEVEVTARQEDASLGGREATTAPPPTPATQQTSPASATEVRDLNSASPTPPQPTERAETEPPTLPPGPPYHFSPGGFPADAYPNGPYPTAGAYPTGAYPTGPYQTAAGGIPFNGYHPNDFRFQQDPYHNPRFGYQPHALPPQPKKTKQQQQGAAGAAPPPPTSRNPNHFGNNYDPFGAFVPGFAPGYPFGVPPHGVDQRGQPVPPFGTRPSGFGPPPPYGPFPPAGAGAGGGGAAKGSAGGGGGGAGAGSQEAADDGDDARQPPARLQATSGAEPTGSGEQDAPGRQPFRQQQLQPFGGFGAQLPQLPYSAFQSSGPGSSPGGPFPGTSNAFYRGSAGGAPPSGFGQASGYGAVAPPALASFNSASQFASDDFLGRQRLQPLYPGAARGGQQQQQQLRSPLFTPQQGLPSGLPAGPGPGPAALAGLQGGRGGGAGAGGSLFDAQQPFSFNNPLFFSGSLDRGVDDDVEPRQSSITSYTASSSGGGSLKASEQDKLSAEGAGVDDDLLGPAVGTLELSEHHLERREDRGGRSRAAERVGFYPPTRR